MASTPLYKFLKQNGTSFYAFPGAAEDISAAYQNENYRMYFSKYTLLNFPKQQTVTSPEGSTQAVPVYWDFDVFSKSQNAIPPQNYADQLIESLRNYVANQEVVIKESRLNSTEYYYDNNEPYTTTEKIFWKWCKKINLIDFEPAAPEDEYFSNLQEFESNNPIDDTYFPEYLWREREVVQWQAYSFYDSVVSGFTGNLEVQFYATTNFRVGDIVKFSKTSNVTNFDIAGIETGDVQSKVLHIIPAGATQGQKVIFDIVPTSPISPAILETTGTVELVYHRLVQYIGEVNGINNVQEANRSYTEVYALIPDHTGKTPDILFRIGSDANYKPNLNFPIIPSQYQPEIVGAELYTSPIVNTPQNYPGSYFGHFDTEDYTYEVSTGDSIRRSGDYYGVSGDINVPVVDGSTVDGMTIDFNTNHYVKMNIVNGAIKTFDQFNALEVNNEPPSDFDFNAILWYYTIEDMNGNISTNLYGISFLDHPDNNPVDAETGIRLPLFKKLVTNGNQDGTSYAFSLNLSFNIINDNPIDSYNPEAINSLYSMNNFNEAMIRLASINDSFLNILAENTVLKEEIDNIRQLVYTQTELDTINTKIKYLEGLLLLYKTNQIQDSETIKVVVEQQPSFSTIKLENIDTDYKVITKVNTTDLYTATGIIPLNVDVPENKNFLIQITNNDEVDLTLPNSDKLTIVIDRDLDYKQSCFVIVDSNNLSTQNKKLDIYLKYLVSNDPNSTTPTDLVSLQSNVPISNPIAGLPVETPIITDINLPVLFNSVTQLPNLANISNKFNFDINLNQPIILNSGNILEVPLNAHYMMVNNSIKQGDSLVMSDFQVGTTSVFDFSGQYKVDSIGVTNSYLYLDITSNPELVAYGASATLPKYIHDPNGYYGTYSTELSNIPYFNLNKGVKYKITRVNSSETSSIEERYLIETEYLL